ncbi:riboflavin biosynthesis protein RibF [Oscillospiraceae bacterium LTW-04]|nr:riboflavin biosynthesis protein RibF [Oscillospiraceae bacterium MB24-C1]
MNIAQDLKIETQRPTAVAVGFFDGVHRGHRAVIEAALSHKHHGLDTCVFSFSIKSASPEKKKGARLLQTPSLKAKSVEALGADWLLTPDFSQFKGLSPEQFALDVLMRGLNAKVVCCGYDYHFGKGACAGAKELAALLEPHGVAVEQVGAVLDNGLPVSSTRIREALAAGEIETANRLLGRPFAIDFAVSHGRGLGRELGFPTANQLIGEEYAQLRFGVYATQVFIDGEAHPAVTNVGIKPTVGSDSVGAESYILDWSGDLYNKPVETQFLSFLRPEQKFESLDALKDAIRKDADRARMLASNC